MPIIQARLGPLDLARPHVLLFFSNVLLLLLLLFQAFQGINYIYTYK